MNREGVEGATFDTHAGLGYSAGARLTRVTLEAGLRPFTGFG